MYISRINNRRGLLLCLFVFQGVRHRITRLHPFTYQPQTKKNNKKLPPKNVPRRITQSGHSETEPPRAGRPPAGARTPVCLVGTSTPLQPTAGSRARSDTEPTTSGRRLRVRATDCWCPPNTTCHRPSHPQSLPRSQTGRHPTPSARTLARDEAVCILPRTMRYESCCPCDFLFVDVCVWCCWCVGVRLVCCWCVGVRLVCCCIRLCIQNGWGFAHLYARFYILFLRHLRRAAWPG
jgi:hypothetical protein